MNADYYEPQPLTDLSRDLLEGRALTQAAVRVLMEDERQQAGLKIRMLSLLADSAPPALREQINRLALIDDDHRVLYALLIGGARP